MADDRLTGLDAQFLHVEDESTHMHVAAVFMFDGDPPEYDEFLEGIRSRLHLVPRYRQKLAFVPYNQGRPKWADDPHLNMRYHVRATALPSPGSEEQLRALAGRVFSQQLDRDKPLWEMWLVEGIEGGRFAILSKTHHALVDGISGVDIFTILFDTKAEPDVPPAAGKRWLPRPMPSRSQMLAEALIERATVPREIVRGVRALFRGPRAILGGVRDSLVGLGALAWAGAAPAPDTPYNTRIGSHRRYAWGRMSLEDVKSIKNSLGGTVNDVMIALVSRALRRHLRRRGVTVDATELRAMVPVSVRAEDARGSLGNKVAAMMAPLPVGCEDTVECYQQISAHMREIKEGGQAVGAQVLTDLTGFAPPTIMSQAARLFIRQRFFNVVVTNVPGPQFPLYLHGRELRDVFPVVPLAPNQGLGIAIMSYNGRINFGLLGDWDVLHDIADLADDMRAALAELAEVAGVQLSPPPEPGRLSRNGQSRRDRERLEQHASATAEPVPGES
jgi:diacylglycerol O-acyltransferase / wax synthase